MQLLDVAYHTVHDYPGGAPSLAPRMGKSPHTLNHEVTGNGSAKFGLVDAVKACQLTGDYRILYAFAEACGHVCIPMPTDSAADAQGVLHQLAETSREFSELCAEVCTSAADGHISDNELERIGRERLDLMGALARLGEAVLSLNQAGKPRHLRGE
ncbi:phage regulatory CII family protein [Malikia sp.]|uniref:phage regulatory CII family protein n=1 Tax=Malikia sp. TaxID=2070706 RepID=UPI002618D953|nr:phage regulatory CII family protein [Malikia sp.]MDD2728190.1 hypothetical protein [Malikia sp.]